jgi:septum formation protein
MYKIILASGSPRRKEILAQAGVDFEVMVSNVSEESDKKEPALLVEELAAVKAEAIEQEITLENEKVLILSADTLVFLEDTPLGKPKDKEDAFRMLRNLSGREHEVYTGVSVIIKREDGIRKQLIFHQRSIVKVAELTDEEINNYLVTGEAFDKAGAYGIQGSFAIHIEGIEGEYYNIVGLPISKIYHELLKEGIDIVNNF